MIAQVIVDVVHSSVDRPFSYLIPEGMPVEQGSRVSVPLGKRRVDGFVVALLSDEATVKRLKLEPDAVWLMPENPDYNPIDGDNAQILGKVKAVIRKY